MKNVACVVIAASLTSGCIMYRLKELRNTTPSGTPFENELSKLYMDFAAKGEKEYDWFNSWHFADKGLMLAYGKDMPPEDLKDWDIPEEVLPDLQRARDMVMATLTPDLKMASPTHAADVEFYFDCWVKYQEANWQQDNISFCRDNLMRTLQDFNTPEMRELAKSAPWHAAKTAKRAKGKSPKLSHVKEPENQPVATVKKTESKPVVIKETHPETISYAVFFDIGKAQLSEPGKNVLGEVIGLLKNVTSYEINLHVSNDKENAALSQERVQVVKKRLIEGGINEHSIKTSDADAETGSAKQPNRRVEIFLNE